MSPTRVLTTDRDRVCLLCFDASRWSRVRLSGSSAHRDGLRACEREKRHTTRRIFHTAPQPSERGELIIAAPSLPCFCVRNASAESRGTVSQSAASFTLQRAARPCRARVADEGGREEGRETTELPSLVLTRIRCSCLLLPLSSRSLSDHGVDSRCQQHERQ